MMRAILHTLLLMLCCQFIRSQQPEDEEDTFSSTQLEDLSQDEESESENDDDVQRLAHYRKNPININSKEVHALPLLDPLLIENLRSYRNLLGDLIDVYELQAVPGFTNDIIKRIMPFLTVRKNELTKAGIKERLQKGVHSLLVRFSVTPEKSAGFRENATGQKEFEGSRPAIFYRYKYQYRDLMQFGFVSDKDPGEKIFVKGPFPDFISAHLFVRQAGIIRSFALGDYTINFGQGLTHWQNQAFRKSSSVINVKRQSEVLRPYQSGGEHHFHRGMAATLEKRAWQSTIFMSHRKISANIVIDSAGQPVITSIQTAGLHRTAEENDDKNVAAVLTAGMNVKKKSSGGHIGMNAVAVRYSSPIRKADEPYNQYAMSGRTFLNLSADYSHTYRNIHLFGEVAVNQTFSRAVVSGMMASLSGGIDLALLLRDISKSYTSVYGNAFTENTLPGNEKGFYAGISMKPFTGWRVDLYADLFSFPWLKYRLDAPSDGAAYLVQVSYRPTRQTEIYTRYRYRIKPLNVEDEEENVPAQEMISNWRSQVSVQFSRSILLRTRVEWCFYRHRFLEFPNSGYLFFTEIQYKPFSSWFSGNVRFQAFEAENYATRIYAYENDLLFVSATPSFYNNGVRGYVNVKGKFRIKRLSNKSLTLSLKTASTIFSNISSIGTGVSAIAGNRSSVFKVQIFLSE